MGSSGINAKPPAYKLPKEPLIDPKKPTPIKQDIQRGGKVKVATASGYLTTHKTDKEKEYDKHVRNQLPQNLPAIPAQKEDEPPIDKKAKTVFSATGRPSWQQQQIMKK